MSQQITLALTAYLQRKLRTQLTYESIISHDVTSHPIKPNVGSYFFLLLSFETVLPLEKASKKIRSLLGELQEF